MPIAAVNQFNAATGYAPVDRVREERQVEEPRSVQGPRLAEIAAANTRSVFQALQTPDVEARRLSGLVASARAASVALVATPDDTDALDDATTTTEAASSARLGEAQQADAADEAVAANETAADEAAAADRLEKLALQGPIEQFTPPSAQEVAQAFAVVAASTPFDPATDVLASDDARIDAIDGVSVRDSLLSGDEAANEPPASFNQDDTPGSRLSRLA